MLLLPLFLLLLNTTYAGDDWYKVRLTVFTPNDPAVRKTGLADNGEPPQSALSRGECVLSASPSYYPMHAIYEVKLVDRDGDQIWRRRCVVRTRGVRGRYHLDLLVSSTDAANWKAANYQMVRRVK